MSRLTLNSNILSLNAQRMLSSHTKDLNSSFARLSSGLRINKASDDAAGLAVSSLLNTDRKVANQGIRNLNDGVSYLNIAESALNELTNIVTRIAEVAEQSANGTLGDSQREALQQEVSSLQNEYNRIIRTTKFNGNQLLTGLATNTILQGGYGTSAQLVTQIGAAALGVASDPTWAGKTTRIDTASDGTVGNSLSSGLTMSANGRYVAFHSISTNLISGDTNGLQDAFLKDTLTGQTTRISTDSNGNQANGASSVLNISADGRYVLFRSNATNLVAGDTNGVDDVYVKDTLTGKTTRVSTDSSGNQSNGASTSLLAGISADGRYAVLILLLQIL